MDSTHKKEAFKLLIREFHSEELPEIFPRSLEIPSSTKKVITIYGPRRSGKSFYLFSIVKKLIKKGIPKERIIYLNFEDDRILPLFVAELNALLEAYFELYPENKTKEIFFLLDEIQNVKDWEVFVRRIQDKENAKIFITGSSSKLLGKEIATALRGRTFSYALYPLNFKEFLIFKRFKLERNFEYSSGRFMIKKFLQEYLEWGGFPEVVLEKNPQLKRKILEEYFNSLVYRDLAERYSLENLDLLKDLFKSLFNNMACLFSVNSYYKASKQNLSVSRQTISEYLAFIQETDYLFLIPKFAYSLKEQKASPKKILCLDNGLRNTITFRFSPDEGKNAENLVGAHLRGQGQEIYFWQGKREVDWVIKTQTSLKAINVTYGDKINQREFEALKEVKTKLKNVKELILITKDLDEQHEQVKFVPLYKWLLS